jgi:hypothetical protein
MATRDDFEHDDETLVDEGLKALKDERQAAEAVAERDAIFAELSARLNQPGVQDMVLARYNDFGRALLADSTPSRVDPKIARALRPYLGDLSDVRVHTGRVASEAAQAMEARAFAIGDSDVFIDAANFDPSSREGGALLAHELAHTRDAATGFALSKEHGSDTSAKERFAEQLELMYAMEYDAEGDAVAADAEDSPNPIGSDFLPKTPDFDRYELARKIIEVIQDQSQLQAERLGRWN